MVGDDLNLKDMDEMQALMAGMATAWHALRAPQRMAILSDFGERTFDQLNARVNQTARLLRDTGLEPGDALAVQLQNRPEMAEVLFACLRVGIRFTPINFHYNADETGYIVDNCEARVFITDQPGIAPEAAAASSRLLLKLGVGCCPEGFTPFEEAIASYSPANITDPVRGSTMLYTSGTTGRPKGVYRRQAPPMRPTRMGTASSYEAATDKALLTGPAYHSAPLNFSLAGPLTRGVGVVMMNKWDAEETLRLIEKHRISHSHLVPTMFHRLLQLPAEVKERYDVSSLRYILHGAAPCPVHVKQGIIEWFGPVVYEYYLATEGGGSYFITPEEWLRKPGSVGKSDFPEDVLVLDEDGEPLPRGEAGYLYFRAPATGRFEYFKANEKTSSSYRGDFYTLGDIGYHDEDGYLFLTGRSAETIISGGVNIYPQEVDSCLMQHEAVQEVCTIGVPNDEWGEEVKSVIELKDGFRPDDRLRDDIIEFARAGLARYMVPRSIDFKKDLPRLISGKIQRGRVRAPYWEGREKSI